MKWHLYFLNSFSREKVGSSFSEGLAVNFEGWGRLDLFSETQFAVITGYSYVCYVTGARNLPFTLSGVWI